jgi:hypothetical protein
MRKSKLNSDGKYRRKSKLNSEKIGEIQKKIVK